MTFSNAVLALNLDIRYNKDSVAVYIVHKEWHLAITYELKFLYIYIKKIT